MSKLNKEILQAISGYVNPNNGDCANKIESICDDFAEKFAEWVNEQQMSFDVNNNIWYDINNFELTTKELLQEFKQHYNKD